MDAQGFNLIEKNDVKWWVGGHGDNGVANEGVGHAVVVGQMRKPSVCTQHKNAKNEPRNPHCYSMFDVFFIIGAYDG